MVVISECRRSFNGTKSRMKRKLLNSPLKKLKTSAWQKHKQNPMCKSISQRLPKNKTKSLLLISHKKISFMYEKLLQIKTKINKPIEKQITQKECKWFPGQKGTRPSGLGLQCQVRCLRHEFKKTLRTSFNLRPL